MNTNITTENQGAAGIATSAAYVPSHPAVHTFL